nr:MAG TPA: hypothetical protein [Caudoviricetes sp.]
MKSSPSSAGRRISHPRDTRHCLTIFKILLDNKY